MALTNTPGDAPIPAPSPVADTVEAASTVADSAAGTDASRATDAGGIGAAGGEHAERAEVATWAREVREAREAKARAIKAEAEAGELRTKLEAAERLGGAAGEAKVAELIDAIKKNPRLLRDRHGLEFQALIDAYSSDEPKVDPKLTEAERRLSDIEARLQAEKDARDADSKAATDLAAKQVEAEYEVGFAKLISDEGSKPRADGTERWALVSTDDGAASWARQRVTEFLTEHNAALAKDGKPPKVVTEAEATHLVSQALDQLEDAYRKRFGTKIHLPLRAKPTPAKHEGIKNTLRENPRQVKPSIDASSRDPLPGANRVKRPMTAGPRRLGIPI